jgi:nitrogen fixation protein FixH
MAKINKKNKAGLIPWIFVAFFATFIVVDIAFFIAARQSWRGVSTKDSYQKGKDYNEVLQKVSKQKQLGWKIESKLTQKAKEIAELKVCLFDKNGTKIKDAKLIVKLTRPVQEGDDFEQNMIEKNSCYSTKIFFAKKGQWDFEFVALRGKKVFQDVKRYIIR